ncbi:MAG: 2,3-dihydroxybiphenyl 1,2-dioxygenase [Proteobacteria bacterium]|nr:2,3-dihydroxybiphenyl 1,2-dioxygenase [Pseudomonadota bacterium]MCP4922064.1 2,3-dihydroxybiphenyl 1,2-dioxygenase [Pseudomonadota bacterium]
MSQLAYVGFEVRDVAAWRELAERVLGLTAIPYEGGFRLRLDDRAFRIEIREGPADDLAFVGWELPVPEGLGVERPDLARERGVERLVLIDAFGTPTELVQGPSRVSSHALNRYPWVAGELGLGHLVLSTPTRAEGEAFYRRLGFELTDRIVAQLGPHELDLAFLHLNPRHHSLALGGPQQKRLHHLMLQLADFDDLGRVLDRARRAGILATTLGRHPNDHVLSFYVKTPSGFQLEIGQGGLVVDDDWTPKTHDRVAVWGHHHLESA